MNSIAALLLVVVCPLASSSFADWLPSSLGNASESLPSTADLHRWKHSVAEDLPSYDNAIAWKHSAAQTIDNISVQVNQDLPTEDDLSRWKHEAIEATGNASEVAAQSVDKLNKDLPTKRQLLYWKHVAATEVKELAHDAGIRGKDWVPKEEANSLRGHSKATNNFVVIGLLLGVGVAAVLGAVVEQHLPASFQRRGHPRGWVVGMLIASYALLIPGLHFTLFIFNIFLRVDLGLLGKLGYNITRVPVTESMWSVIGLLLKTGGNAGAALVILYAMVMPAVKMSFLLLGELLRANQNPNLRRISCWSISIVQITSKWACPDMFAYILLLFLFRHMNHPPLIASSAIFDVGFACFCVFCVCSTLSTLAIHQPVAVESALYAPVKQPTEQALQPTDRKQIDLIFVVLMAVSFAVLLYAGLHTPCMGLHVDTNILQKPKGPVPHSMKWMVDEALDDLEITPLLHADVSIRQCIGKLAEWALQGEAACVLAFAMLALFAIALTALDMMVLLVAAVHIGQSSANIALCAARVLKHIAMLDVMCMGVGVVSLAAGAYKEQGFDLQIRKGLVALVGAEVIHYMTYHFVCAMASREEGNDAVQSKASSDSDVAAEFGMNQKLALVA